VAFLPSMPSDLEHRHALDANFLQRAFHSFQLGVLDNRFNLRHDVVLIFLLPQANSMRTQYRMLTLSSGAAPRKLKLFIVPIRIYYCRKG
jgi:hypothetical protein